MISAGPGLFKARLFRLLLDFSSAENTLMGQQLTSPAELNSPTVAAQAASTPVVLSGLTRNVVVHMFSPPPFFPPKPSELFRSSPVVAAPAIVRQTTDSGRRWPGRFPLVDLHN